MLFVVGCGGSQHAPVAGNNAETAAFQASLNSNRSASPSAPPADLTGLEPVALQHLFGEPGLVRKDYPAEVWQYRNPSCVLDIYLYPDHDRLTVAHAEARAPKLGGDPLSACIAQFTQSRQKTMG